MAQITRKKKEKTYLLQRWSLALLAFLALVGFLLVHEHSNPVDYDTRTSQGTSLLALNEMEVRPEDALDHPEYLYERRCLQESASLSSIQSCYPDAPLQQPWAEQDKHPNPACDTHKLLSNNPPLINWNTLQNCLVGRRNPHSHKQIIPPSQFQIHVIGERNSGTKWLQQEIAKCFPKETVGVRCHRDFLRSKHFFQPPVRGNYESHLVIAIVRDPLEWLAAMREKPYHMPYHMAGFDTSSKKLPAIPLDWSTFLERAAPWTFPGLSAQDQQVVETTGQHRANVLCVQAFSFDGVTPCIFHNTTIPRSKWRGHMPIYELQRDRSGHPFADLLKLRSDKILNFFLEIPLLMNLGGYAAVRYEDLLRNGTQAFLEQVAAMMGMASLPEACRPQMPHPERIGHRAVPPQVQQWVEDHLVLETEQLLGYR